MLVALARNPAPAFSWQHLQELKTKEIPVHTFDVGGFQLTHNSENYIIYEHWLPNELNTNIVALKVYFLFFTIGLIILLSLVSVLPTFSFYVCCSLWIFIASFFQFEELKIFGFENKIFTIIFIITTLVPVFYFHFIDKNASFFKRLIASTLALLILLFIIFQFALIPLSLLQFATNTLPIAMIIFVVFTILVAHEIIASFLFISSKGGRQSSVAKHFFLISGIYLLNLWLAYWSKIGWLNWNATFPFVILFSVSLVLALWNLRSKEILFENYFPNNTLHYFYFIGLSIIATSTVGYFLATANNPTLIGINDLILYSHLGYGMMFIVYIISNFLGVFDKGIPIFKIIYKPNSMPYFTYRLAGLIVTIFFLAYNRWQGTTNRMMSGFNAAKADVFEKSKEGLLAFGYYKKSVDFAPYNHHSATKIATLSANNGNIISEGQYLQEANLFRPTEFTIVNEANWHAQNGQILKEILVLKDGIKKIPSGNKLKNNLGLAFAKLQLQDSAMKYFAECKSNDEVGKTASLNIVGMLAENNLQINPDSIYSLIDKSSIALKTNILALGNRMNNKVNLSYDFLTDSTLNLFSATLIGNFITNHHTQIDTAFLTKCISYAEIKKNSLYKNIILTPVAKAFFEAGQITKAFELYTELIAEGEQEGKLNAEFALFFLDLERPEMALEKIKYSQNQGFDQAPLLYAIALTEAGQTEEAIEAWKEVSKQKTETTNKSAEEIIRILKAPKSEYSSFSEKEKYQYIRFRIPFRDSKTLNELIEGLKDENLQAKSYLWQAKKWFQIDEIVKARLAFNKIQNLHLNDLGIFDKIRYFELKLLASEGAWDAVLQQISEIGELSQLCGRSEKIYFEAFQYLHSGDTVLAERNFSWLGKNNPYFDEGVVASANFFQNQDSISLAYDILAQALLANPKSIKILKAYIMVAPKVGLDRFADSALLTLRGLISVSDFKEFNSLYNKSKEIMN